MPSTVEFATFCHAARAWLASAPSLDPALVAVADLLARGPLEPGGLEYLRHDPASADSHTLLGANTLAALVEVLAERT